MLPDSELGEPVQYNWFMNEDSAGVCAPCSLPKRVKQFCIVWPHMQTMLHLVFCRAAFIPGLSITNEAYIMYRAGSSKAQDNACHGKQLDTDHARASSMNFPVRNYQKCRKRRAVRSSIPPRPYKLPRETSLACEGEGRPTAPGHDEQLPDHSGALPDVFLHQLAARNPDEGAVGVVRHGARQQRLGPCPGARTAARPWAAPRRAPRTARGA